MTAVIGIHGFAQQQLGRHQLRDSWSKALTDGLERAGDRQLVRLEVDVLFYGDLLLPVPAEGPVLPPPTGLDDLTSEELEFLSLTAACVLDPGEMAASDRYPARSHLAIPVQLAAPARALDLKFGPGSGLLFLGSLRQVRRYLIDKEIKSAIDDRVARYLNTECRILIGHSLGSVIAFEYVRSHPEHHLDLLLTIGSPLGLETVRAALPAPAHGVDAGIPSNLGLWVNLRDPHDPVAGAGHLAAWWPAVQDALVNNQSEPHSAERYLAKLHAGHAVLSVAPELAVQEWGAR
jgi:hypothetical protein